MTNNHHQAILQHLMSTHQETTTVGTIQGPTSSLLQITAKLEAFLKKTGLLLEELGMSR